MASEGVAVDFVQYDVMCMENTLNVHNEIGHGLTMHLQAWLH